MTAISRIPLSGSTDGRGIKIAATAIATGDTIHTAQAAATDGKWDEITLDLFNSDTVERTLTIGWGGTTDPDDLIDIVLAAGEYRPGAVIGLCLRNGLALKAAASAANVVIVFGQVTRAV